ncbi:MAG: methyltransferase domain-containing protein, partial [Deltaproteobacteria bacterium]|nr:methyltransferase domain-containing protein [Deltaproteobacteria bacterium]
MTLICPSCHVELESLPTALHCPGCGRLVPTDGGFPDFVGEDDLDWGELSVQEMEQVVQQAREVAWYVPLLKIAEEDSFLAYYILDRSRAGWVFHCLHPTGNEVCIDLGSGWGNIAFTLSDWYKTVWSVEAVRARVEFQTIRARQEGRDNLHPIRSMLLSLPFADNTADLVVCSGVLEWIGLSDFIQSVEMLQSTFL